MINAKSFSKKVGFIIIFSVLLIGALFGVLTYLSLSKLILEVGPVLQADPNTIGDLNVWNLVLAYQPKYWYTVFPAMLTFTLVVGLLAWLVVKSGIDRPAPSAQETVEQIHPGREAEEKDLSDRRFFLHLFSLMQREGRMMDFLNEDLERYEDAQIGSAVRSIHAGCRQIVEEYLNPKPVMEYDEGAEVTVPVDFDPGVIKLTGNVVGKPPFKGILRHKGWQVGKMHLPALSGRQNAKIITPAEVEIT